MVGLVQLGKYWHGFAPERERERERERKSQKGTDIVGR
jgi:hypothetical protein